MSIRLSIPVEGYRVRADVSVPAGCIRAAELLPVHREISKAVTEAVVAREVRAGATISCRKGCSACCKRLYVEVTEAEAYRLQDTIGALRDDHRRRVDARFAEIRKRVLKAGLYDEMLRTNLEEGDIRERLSLAFYEQNLACPFLEQDACSIYEERPLACREYLVTSPAEECSRPAAGHVRRIPWPWPTFEFAMRMTRRALDKARLVPLALLPDWIAQNPEPAASKSGVELLMRSFSGAALDVAVAEEQTGTKHVERARPHAPDPGPLADEDAEPGEIVPDYETPDALMVPHYGFDRLELLERIASAASHFIGVILLTPDPEKTRAFIDRQDSPERFSLLLAGSDTAWIRDRAPIAARCPSGETNWHLPRLPEDGRDADASLFQSICARPLQHVPFKMARGNLVAGPDGVALSTSLVLEENGSDEMQRLTRGVRRLGVKRWILFPPFTREPTRHADLHARFLGPDLAAVAWNLSSEEDRAIAEDLANQLIEVRPGLRVLRVPMRSENSQYASPLNWIQLGRDLLVPRYPLTEESDVEQIRALLEAEEFNPTFIESPTLDAGGSLHCLTASIHL